MVGVRAQGGEVVPVQVGGEAERGRQLGEGGERGPLVAGHARDPQQRRGIADQGVRVEAGERSRILHNCPFGE